jgi:hypothetical protein
MVGDLCHSVEHSFHVIYTDITIQKITSMTCNLLMNRGVSVLFTVYSFFQSHTSVNLQQDVLASKHSPGFLKKGSSNPAVSKVELFGSKNLPF